MSHPIPVLLSPNPLLSLHCSPTLSLIFALVITIFTTFSFLPPLLPPPHCTHPQMNKILKFSSFLLFPPFLPPPPPHTHTHTHTNTHTHTFSLFSFLSSPPLSLFFPLLSLLPSFSSASLSSSPAHNPHIYLPHAVAGKVQVNL